MLDRVAFYNIQAIRRTYDFVTGYGPHMTKDKWLTRILFLETVAGVPGMVAGMIRHLHSLRLMRRDQGWIHTLLSEVRGEGVEGVKSAGSWVQSRQEMGRALAHSPHSQPFASSRRRTSACTC